MSRGLALFVAGLIGCFLPDPAFSTAEQQTGPEAIKLSLAAAVRSALDRAPEVLLAKAQALRADAAVRETQSLKQPQVVLGTGLAYNNGFPLSMEGSAPALFQVGMSQSVFSKKNNKLIREAEESRKASQQDVETARNELASIVTLAYQELHQTRKIEAIWISRSEFCNSELEVVASKLQAGRARPLDLAMARTAASRAAQQLLVVREQARMAETQLKELTGLAPASTLVTEEPRLEVTLPELQTDKLLQSALEANPEVRSAEAVLQAREHRVEAEKASEYPRLEIVGQYALFSRVNNYQDYFNRFTRNNFLLGMSVQVPVLDGRRTSARVAQSRQEVAEAQLRLQRLKSEIKMDLERSVSALRIAQGAADLARQERATALENVQVVQSLFEAGRVEAKELQAARDQVLEKELGSLEADKALYRQRIELLRLTGKLTSLF
jgi:outer membrane protein